MRRLKMIPLLSGVTRGILLVSALGVFWIVSEIGMTHGSSDQRLQSALENAVSKNRKGKGGGLLAISPLDPAEVEGFGSSTFVTGRLRDSDGALVQADTPYGLASITKSFVAALTFIYAERGLLDLDSPILGQLDDESWLLDQARNPKFRRNLERVTIRELLAHRSGFADYWDDEAFYRAWRSQKGKHWSHMEILDLAGKMAPLCKVGQCFKYADTNYVVLGLILERKFGKKLHDLLREAIFDPLGMRCTWMFFEEPRPAGCKAVAHSYEDKLDVTANPMQSADWSGGGLYSTADDQVKFLRGLFGKPGLLSPASLKDMMGWRKGDREVDAVYGLGLYKLVKGPHMTLIGHTGVHNSFSFLWQEPGILFTGSLNQEENNAVDKLLYPVMRILAREGLGRDTP